MIISNLEMYCEVYEMDKSVIYKMCMEKEWIFSDFFDTLVHRRVSEDTVRQIWANRVSEQVRFSVSAKEIYAQRNVAATHILKKSNKEEVTYSEIIREIYCALHKDLSNYSFVEFEKMCYEIEINTELEYLYIDIGMYDLLCTLKSERKKIALISDYSLPISSVKYYMSKLGINNLFDLIFISSEHGVRKKTGHLYTRVLDQIERNCSAIMIGDNRESDYVRALEAGLSAYHKNKIYNSTEQVESALKRISKGNCKEPFANYSFELYTFIERLYIQLVKNRFKSVYFMAREGYFLKKLFDEYQSNKQIKVHVNYLYVSRKSTLLASIYREHGFDFTSLFLTYDKLDVRSFLKNLSFSKDEMMTALINFPYDYEAMINNFSQSEELKWLLDKSKTDFCSILYDKCKTANDLLKKYILQGISINEDRIAIVDVGWKGTIQDNIYFALGEQYTVQGFYLGIENITLRESNLNIKEGLLFSLIPTFSTYYAVLDFETHLIEQLLVAPHGSTYGYEEHNGIVQPILEEYYAADRELFNVTDIIQNAILNSFRQIRTIFDGSVENTYTMEKFMMKECMKAALLLNYKSIVYEKIALNSSTNNFGWFSKTPVSLSKKEKLRSMMKDMKQIHMTKMGIMRYLNYFAVKMNARKKYIWKIPVYRIVYVIQNLMFWIKGVRNVDGGK